MLGFFSLSKHLCGHYLAAAESLGLLNAQNGDNRASGCSLANAS